MAMTKKEAAAMQAAIDRAETLAALRWTAPVKPDLPAPNWANDRMKVGWTYNANAMRVEPAWSECIRHGTGEPPVPGVYSSASQRSIDLHSTELRAWRAMRHDVECRAAADLLKIDRHIAELQAAEGAK